MNYIFELETLYLKIRRTLQGSGSIRYFSADQHYSHRNIILYCSRPFKDVQEMNEALVRRHNAMVRPQDTVFFLGDFSLNDNVARDFGKRLNGTKFLVPGNHDRCFWSDKKLVKYREAGFTVLPKHGKLYIDRYLVQIAHMPYGDDESKKYDTRYFEHRPIKGNEDMLLHGHQHSKYLKNKDRIDVGIDNNFRLYSDRDIIKLIEDKRSFIPSRLDGQVSRHGEAG